MVHPNIAKVLDAGTTERGRPYFVMELVKGTPITQFCASAQAEPVSLSSCGILANSNNPGPVFVRLRRNPSAVIY
jgi:hypothetical protein